MTGILNLVKSMNWGNFWKKDFAFLLWVSHSKDGEELIAKGRAKGRKWLVIVEISDL